MLFEQQVRHTLIRSFAERRYKLANAAAGEHDYCVGRLEGVAQMYADIFEIPFVGAAKVLRAATNDLGDYTTIIEKE